MKNDQIKTKVLGKRRISLFNKDQVDFINKHLEDNIEVLLEHFEIEYKHSGKILQMCCPIHIGDNASACNIYINKRNEDDNVHWACRTHLCHKKFANNMIGFVRGILTSRQDIKIDKYNFMDTLNFIVKFYNLNVLDIKASNNSDEEKVIFNRIVKNTANATESNIKKMSRSEIRNRLKIPSAYFFKRNFNPAILDAYDVGDCYNTGTEMSYRAVAPIYDANGEYIGATGRSLNPKCPECGFYHSPNSKEHFAVGKWKNTSDLQRDNVLYNLNKASDYITKTSTIIVVESPGNVWRLIEFGAYNAVATLGTAITENQKNLICQTGAMSIIYIPDNDVAGANAANEVLRMFHKTHKVFIVKINKEDVAEMNIEDFNQFIKPYIIEAENLYK